MSSTPHIDAHTTTNKSKKHVVCVHYLGLYNVVFDVVEVV